MIVRSNNTLYITKLKDGYVRVGMKATDGSYGLTIDMKGEDVIKLVKMTMNQVTNEDALQERR